MAANKRAEVDAATADLDFEKVRYQVKLETTEGTILLDLLPAVAPEHCRNLIGLTKIGFYDGVIFHRVIAGFMIQGGCPLGTGSGGPGYRIDEEFNETPHVAGTLSMARTNDPNSAGSQFFICLGKQAFLDRQYTAFGQTADDASYKVVEKIGASKTDRNDRPVKEVKITKATVLESPA